MPVAGVAYNAATLVMALLWLGLSGRGRLGPGAEVFGAGVPGPAEGFPSLRPHSSRVMTGSTRTS